MALLRRGLELDLVLPGNTLLASESDYLQYAVSEERDSLLDPDEFPPASPVSSADYYCEDTLPGVLMAADVPSLECFAPLGLGMLPMWGLHATKTEEDVSVPPLVAVTRTQLDHPLADCPAEFQRLAAPFSEFFPDDKCFVGPIRKGRNKVARFSGPINKLLAERKVDASTLVAAMGAPETPDQKRTFLNVLERARREDLKASFAELRDCIPDLSGNKRAAKGIILKKAGDFIKILRREETDLETQMEILREANHNLRQKLAAHGQTPCPPC